MHFHNGILYYAGRRYEGAWWDKKPGEVFETIKDTEGKNPIARRSSPVKFLVSGQDGRLYDAGKYGLGLTLEDRIIHVFEDPNETETEEWRKHKPEITHIISHNTKY